MSHRFTPVQQRASIRIVISEKFVEVFNWYGADLDSIQVLYNKHKVRRLQPSCFFKKLNQSAV